ncbi:hypothetical protein FKB34_01790 [Glycocaulis profundi]|nr:hypothetical protein FKB34_01790 [Glycocaulis profundi]
MIDFKDRAIHTVNVSQVQWLQDEQGEYVSAIVDFSLADEAGEESGAEINVSATVDRADAPTLDAARTALVQQALAVVQRIASLTEAEIQTGLRQYDESFAAKFSLSKRS